MSIARKALIKTILQIVGFFLVVAAMLAGMIGFIAVSIMVIGPSYGPPVAFFGALVLYGIWVVGKSLYHENYLDISVKEREKNKS